MKLEKFKALKQKIICIPIIIVTLLSFVIPNYAYAGIGDTVVEVIVDVFLFIPNSINTALQAFFMKDQLEDATMVSEPSDLYYGPGLIFSNNIKMFDVNFFENKDDSDSSLSAQLRNVISTWYVTLRNISLTLMMLILVYVGIRITISSVASDKAKYKQMLLDWLVAICLLVFMHYIMIFAVNLTEAFVKMFSGAVAVDSTTEKKLDFAVRSAFVKADASDEALDKFYWAFIYLIYTCLSVFFTCQYLMRVIKLVFLTLFAPLMAATYPIDKMGDTKSQTFDRWLKDYIYTLLVQPLHLLLYSILVMSVPNLASTNGIYGIVAICALIPLEKMAREYFNFERGHVKGPNTAGVLATAGLAANAIKGLSSSNVNRKNGNNSGSNGQGGNSNNDNSQIRTSNNSNKAFEMFDDDENRDEDKNQKENDNEEQQNPQGDKFEGQEEMDSLGEELDKYDYNDFYTNPEAMEKQQRYQELDQQRKQWEENKNNSEKSKEDDNNRKDPKDDDNKNKDEASKTARFKAKAGQGLKAIRNSQLGRGVGNVGRSIGRRASNYVKSQGGALGIAGKVGRTGLRIAGATTLMAAGAAMGAATGDGGKAMQFAAAGALLGSKVGDTASRGVKKVAGGAKTIVDDFRKGANSDRYYERLEEKDEKQKQKQTKENYNTIINDDKAMLEFRKANPKLAKEGKLEDAVMSYAEKNITDVNDIKKGLELENSTNYTRKSIQSALMLANKYDEKTVREQPDKLTNSMARQFEAAGAKNPTQEAESRMDLLRHIYRI